MRRTAAARIARAALPYAAVGIGLYGLRSAWTAILLYHAGILLFRLVGEAALPLSAIRRGLWGRLLLPAALICAAAGPALILLWPWVRSADGILPLWLAEMGLAGGSWLVFAVYFALVHPLLEELHWRDLDAGQPNRPVWTDLAFAGYHLLVLQSLLQWPWLIAVFLVLSVSSVFWRSVTARTGGLAFPVISHGIADASVIMAAYYLSQS